MRTKMYTTAQKLVNESEASGEESDNMTAGIAAGKIDECKSLGEIRINGNDKHKSKRLRV